MPSFLYFTFTGKFAPIILLYSDSTYEYFIYNVIRHLNISISFIVKTKNGHYWRNKLQFMKTTSNALIFINAIWITNYIKLYLFNYLLYVQNYRARISYCYYQAIGGSQVHIEAGLDPGGRASQSTKWSKLSKYSRAAR